MREGCEKVEKKLKTLPEAQRTQGIEFITGIMFLTENNLKVFQMKKFIQVLNSIPWVRCASGNVFIQPPVSRVSISMTWASLISLGPIEPGKSQNERIFKKTLIVCHKFDPNPPQWDVPHVGWWLCPCASKGLLSTICWMLCNFFVL